MYKSKRNFAIKLDIDEQISSMKNSNNTSYTKELNKILEIGLEKIKEEEKLKSLEKQIDSITKLLFMNFELTKQIYADLNFPIKEVETSETLNRFLSKKRVGRFND